MKKEDYLHFRQFCSKHREILLKSRQCGCFFCHRIFSPDLIKEWIDNEQTAICPYCEVDAILGDLSVPDLTEDFLVGMHVGWFNDWGERMWDFAKH